MAEPRRRARAPLRRFTSRERRALPAAERDRRARQHGLAEHLELLDASTDDRCSPSTPSGRARGSRSAACTERASRQTERWIAVRSRGAVASPVVQVVLEHGYPPGYEREGVDRHVLLRDRRGVLFALSRTTCRARGSVLAVVALGFDTAVVSAYLLVYNFERGSPSGRFCTSSSSRRRSVRIVGPSCSTASTLPVLIEFEQLRADQRRRSTPTTCVSSCGAR
jgi:hypothetical protein